MCQKLIICVVLIGFAAADVSRNEKGTGGNGQIADVSGSGSTQQISGVVSGWSITKNGDCTKFYGKVINVAPSGKPYIIVVLPGACSASKSTDVKTLTASHAGYVGSATAASLDGQTYIIVDHNKKGISGASLPGKSIVISDGTKIVGCGDMQKGEIVVLMNSGVNEGTCP